MPAYSWKFVDTISNEHQPNEASMSVWRFDYEFLPIWGEEWNIPLETRYAMFAAIDDSLALSNEENKEKTLVLCGHTAPLYCEVKHFYTMYALLSLRMATRTRMASEAIDYLTQAKNHAELAIQIAKFGNSKPKFFHEIDDLLDWLQSDLFEKYTSIKNKTTDKQHVSACNWLLLEITKKNTQRVDRECLRLCYNCVNVSNDWSKFKEFSWQKRYDMFKSALELITLQKNPSALFLYLDQYTLENDSVLITMNGENFFYAFAEICYNLAWEITCPDDQQRLLNEALEYIEQTSPELIDDQYFPLKEKIVLALKQHPSSKLDRTKQPECRIITSNEYESYLHHNYRLLSDNGFSSLLSRFGGKEKEVQVDLGPGWFLPAVNVNDFYVTLTGMIAPCLAPETKEAFLCSAVQNETIFILKHHSFFSILAAVCLLLSEKTTDPAVRYKYVMEAEYYLGLESRLTTFTADRYNIYNSLSYARKRATAFINLNTQMLHQKFYWDSIPNTLWNSILHMSGHIDFYYMSRISSTKEAISWSKTWQSLTWSTRYEIFSANNGLFEKLNEEDLMVFFNTNDYQFYTHKLVCNGRFFFAAFAEICYTLANMADDSSLQRKYLREAKQHCLKAETSRSWHKSALKAEILAAVEASEAELLTDVEKAQYAELATAQAAQQDLVAARAKEIFSAAEAEIEKLDNSIKALLEPKQQERTTPAAEPKEQPSTLPATASSTPRQTPTKARPAPAISKPARATPTTPAKVATVAKPLVTNHPVATNSLRSQRTPISSNVAPTPPKRTPAVVVTKPRSSVLTKPAHTASSTPGKTAANSGIHMAQQALDKQNYALAEELFDSLCEQEPTNIEALLGHANSLLQLSLRGTHAMTKRRQLTYAQEQLKKAFQLDKKGRFPLIDELRDQIEVALAGLSSSPPNQSPTTSASSQEPKASQSLREQYELPSNLQTASEYTLCFETVLGQGAAGVVYRGRWNDEVVAIKRYHATQLRGDELREFLKEASFMMDLSSPYLIKLNDFVAQSPYYCMVMEYMPHGSLYQVLGSGVELPWSTRWTIAMDITYGLAALHSKDIIHRDIKSLNVLIGNGFRAKLADFGQAKLKSSSQSVKTRRSESGAVGTVAWLAPEILRDGAECSRATDIYSYGMTLWELATRETPFSHAPNITVMTHWISQGKHENLNKVTTPKLAKLIRWCWQNDAALRPTVEQVIEALDDATPKHVSQAVPRINLFSQ